MGRHAASAKLQLGRLGDQVPGRHRHALGEGSGVALGQDRTTLGGPDSVAGGADHRVDHDIGRAARAVDNARCIGTEHHGQLLRGQSHPAQRPQVVVVERCGPHLHDRPVGSTLGGRGVRHLGDLEGRHRVVGGEPGGIRGEHDDNLRLAPLVVVPTGPPTTIGPARADHRFRRLRGQAHQIPSCQWPLDEENVARGVPEEPDGWDHGRTPAPTEGDPPWRPAPA